VGLWCGGFWGGGGIKKKGGVGCVCLGPRVSLGGVGGFVFFKSGAWGGLLGWGGRFRVLVGRGGVGFFCSQPIPEHEKKKKNLWGKVCGWVGGGGGGGRLLG